MTASVTASPVKRSGHNLCVETVTTRAGLEALADGWNDLLRASGSNSVFLTQEWVGAWLDVMPAALQIRVFVVRDDKALVAIAPFYQVGLRLLNTFVFRCLRVIGDIHASSDYPDVIVDPRRSDQAIRSLGAALLSDRHWDLLWMPNACGWTGSAGALEAQVRAQGGLSKARPRDFAALRLPGDYQAYLALLSSNARSSIKRQSRKILGDPSARISRCDDPVQLSTWLDHLFVLNTRRWNADGRPGSFPTDTPKRAFYRRFADVALERGWLQLWALELHGRVVSIQHGYGYNAVFYQIQEGYDPDVPGAGSVLRARVIEHCINSGFREYDFLGGYSDHKRRWGAEERHGLDVLLAPRRLKGKLLFAAGIWPTGKYTDWTAN